MKMYRVITLLLAAALALVAGCDEATLGPDPRGSIEGRVLESASLDPIAGANVVTSPPTNALVTDSDGSFSLSDVDAGNYTVTAKKPGYVSSSVTISVSDGRTSQANLLMDTEEEEATGVVDVSIINWANRVVTEDSVYADVEYRIRNLGTKDIASYEIYFQIDTDGEQFFQEAEGENLFVDQTDISTFSKYIRNNRATQVTVSGLWIN